MRLFVISFIVLGLFGQSTDLPTFEVASVKPNNLDTRGFIGAVPGGKGFKGFKATNARLKVLIMMAYDIADWQLSEGPGWVEAEGFDIDAKAQNPTSYQQIHLMLQSLLTDRFKLKIHHETKEQPVYALVVETDRHKLLLHDDDGASPLISAGAQPGERVFRNISISRLAWLLSGETGRTVLDKTGLAGSYDFKLAWSSSLSKGSNSPEAEAPGGRSIFAALREQLGLRLESQRGPTGHLTIEHVERPSAN
jgi:uncharacterized protein (TIGR03435 family)